MKEEKEFRETKISARWIIRAVNDIKSGFFKRLEKDGVVVYQCGTIIRIDIKGNINIGEDE